MTYTQKKKVQEELAQAREARVRELYRIGETARELLQRTRKKRGSVYGKRLIEKFAEEHSMPRSSVDKAVQFARVYNRKELDELCKFRNAKGMGIGVGHINYLISVSDKRVRRKLEQEIVAKDWTTRRLQQEIHERYGKSSRGGRPPVVSEDHLLLQQVQRKTRNFLAWYHELCKSPTAKHMLASEIRIRLQRLANGFHFIEEVIERSEDQN